MDDKDKMAWLKSLTDPVGELAKMRRCICEKMLTVNEHTTRWYSGIVNYDETLCGDCRRNFKGHARIVCLGCKSLQGFMKPQTAKTGFKFEADRHYHIEVCPRCRPDKYATQVLEHEQFCRARRVVTVANLDLIQEIEQKTLQGVAAADKLRQEINNQTSGKQ